MGRGANQQDVARAAGVSVSTVSRALSNARGISAELRAHIQQLADELGYHARGGVVVRPLARAYVTVGAISGRHAGFYQALIECLKQRAAEEHVDLEVRLLPGRDMSPADLTADAHLPRPAATLLIGIDPTEEIASRFGPGNPLMLVNAFDPQMRFDCVAPNYYYGSLIATRALIAAGHRDLLYLRDHHRWTSQQRLHGFLAAIEEADNVRGVVADTAPDRDAAITAIISERKANRSAFTAALVTHDIAAIRFVHALKEADLEVPGDISVVGFDDLPPASMLVPRLSTIRVDFGALAERTLGLLSRRLAEPKSSIVQAQCAVSMIIGETISQLS
jgi:DNA-binding LacI/PurR family transcriptional regulator